MKYPQTRTLNQADDYHGTLVADPYRWLENTDSPETRAWIAAQNELTFDYLGQIPARDAIRRRLAELWDYERRLAPVERGGRYFQLRNTGLQNQDVLYVASGFDSEGRVLLDPNTLSPDGTVAMTEWIVSKDGRWLAYATSASGSDWLVWRVRDVDSGEDLPDVIEWSKFSTAAWLPDGSGFYYSRYDPPAPGGAYESINQNQKLCFHRRGAFQSEDVIVYERPDHPDWGFTPTVTDDGRYLAVEVWQGTETRNLVFYQDLHSSGDVIELIGQLEANYAFVDNDGPLFYFRTDRDAPAGRLIAIDVNQPDRAAWRTIVPEAAEVLEYVKRVAGRFVALYLHDAHHLLKLFGADGHDEGEVPLPAPGSLETPRGPGISGNRDGRELFYVFNSFVHPPAVYRYDFAAAASDCLFRPEVPFDAGRYVTDQVFATSKDGTRVPMFLVHRDDWSRDGHNPCLLWGYGGFNISLTPGFAAARLVWLEMGGTLAVANLRGGGEYGEAWHQAGSLADKQNVFDDFIACAEHLIATGVTSTPKLAIEGRSNGGLLVGACLNQRPDLFGAALPGVGVMDMLRFHRFTIGWAWVSDYGSPDDPEQFRTLYAYSPLHNIRPGACYPPTLITTADHDDRVVPGHSFKYAAALQAAQGCGAPILIRIDVKAGHGFGKPTALQIEERADLFAFLIRSLEIAHTS